MTELVKVADINKAHKNPIAELVQIACKFDSHIEIEGEGKNINAKSLMGIMAFGLKEGIEVKVTATGSDESNATDAIRNFLTCKTEVKTAKSADVKKTTTRKTPAKAAAKETVKETKKEAAKTVETVKKAAGETKEAAKKVEADVKATAKSVEAEVKTAVTAKKAAVKKTASKAAAKTAAKAVKEVKAKKPAIRKTTKAAKNTFDKELFFQYANKQVDEETLVARIVEDAKEQNVEIKELKMYLKPEDNACYYVANGNVAGRVNLY